jgi:hypothetical protein
MYRFDNNSIVFSGWEKGIADNPYEGFFDLRNIDITSTPGEAAVAFTNATVTLPPVFNTVAYTAQNSGDTITVASVTGLYAGCAIVLASNTAGGLSDATVYYVRNIVGLTFQVSLYPSSAIVAVTSDGTGTLTTYQYGNQRGLTNNGCPVSYWEAPEIGGVLLCDLSNYVWLWQQGSSGASAQNTLLFLGNIGGIGAATGNQTGVAYWKGYVCVIQQPATIDLLNWEQFSSSNGSAWLSDPLQQYLSITMTASQPDAANMQSAYARLTPTVATSSPFVVTSGELYEAGSSTTITSGSFTMADDDWLIVWSVSLNNITSDSGTFNSNALTNLQNITSTGMRTSLWSYQASGNETSSIQITFNSASTDRVVMYMVVRGASAVQTSSITGATSTTTSSRVSLQQKPNVFLAFGAAGKDADGVITFSSPVKSLQNPTGNSAGCWGIGYVVEQGQEETLKKNVPVEVGENNILYWGSGEQYIGSLNADPTFSPTGTVSVTNQVVVGGLTYNLNGQALDLPENERVESILSANGALYLGATSNKLYPWDTISPSFNDPVEFPEYGLSTLIPSNNTFYVLGGNLGRVYATNGSSVSIFKEVPGELTGTERPYFFFWDGNVGNGELYFSFEAYPNGSSTALDTVGGVWAINANTGALRLVQRPQEGYDVVTRMVCPVGHGQSQEFLRPAGQGLLLGYTDGSSHFLEFSTSNPYSNYEAYIETDIVPVGTYFSQQTFEHIEYKLATPLVTGESIRISQRSNLTTTYTQVAEFTTTGLISDQASINWENVQWVQFRVELKSTQTNPSFVRLKEFRLR